VRDEIETYRKFNVRPFGLNPASPDKHKAYAARLQLPFVLLSDPEARIAKAYHATPPWGMGITRTVYLVGMDGHIAFGARGAPGADVSLEVLMREPPDVTS
jgi:peroxiredoxin